MTDDKNINDSSLIFSQFAISDFAINAKAAPSRIIFYRDGVSEGEYDIVQKTEIASVLGSWAFLFLRQISHRLL